MPDPVSRLYRNARREAWFVICLWFAALIWTVGYCYLRGYEHDPDSWLVRNGLAISRSADNFGQVAGFPDWVFFGIIAPWMVCTVITVWFGLRGMTDDDLGAEAGEGGHGA